MGACFSRERNTSLTTTWAEVTAPAGISKDRVPITEQRLARRSNNSRDAPVKSSRSEKPVEFPSHHQTSMQRHKRKKKNLVTQTKDDEQSLAVSILPNTTVATAVSNSPKSIIIPEITEHSSSSDDELMMDEMILKDSKGGRAVMQRIDPNHDIEPEASLESSGLTHTRAAVGTSTTLRPPHRRRRSKSRGSITAFPVTDSCKPAMVSEPTEDIVYQPNDPNSTAILRRFLSPVMKTKPPPPPKATSFTQVHMSLTQSPIQEDDDSPPSPPNTNASVPLTTPIKRGALTRTSSSSAPSDEEADPTITNARASRRRKSNTMEIGRLSPIKLKTSTCVSPQSIRVYYDTSPQQELSVPKKISTDPSATCKESEVHPRRPDVGKTEASDEAVPALAVTNFSKLQLQVAVAAKHSLKQRVITKIDDRMQDVQQHRQLWDEYHAIQKELQKPPADDVPTGADCPVKTAEDPTSPSNELPVKKEVTATSVRRRRRRRFLQSRKAMDDAVSEIEGNIKPPVEAAVEYDMEDDIAVLSKHKACKSPKKTSTRRSTPSDQESTKTLDTNPKTPRRRRQRPPRPPINTSESSTTSQPSKGHKRVSSFDLHETQTWFFDFQEEFVHVATTDLVQKGSTTIVTPSGDMISTVGKVKSQSDLSLLSASSLEVQRQLYAEKRRLRKMKHSSLNEVVTAPNDDTPPIRNGPRLGRYNDGMSTGSAKSYNSNTSYDYGPTRRRLQAEGRHASGIPVAGSAQQILEASTEEEKLRIAREILKVRSMTHMEVAFTPKSMDVTADAEDTGSFVSDLDETSSYTSLANSSYASNNDYGVKRRVRRSFHYQAEDEDTDDPSVVSEVSLDLSQTKSVERKNRQLGNANVPVYDFQSIVQRRLDIEERLRALMVEENPAETAVPEATRPLRVSTLTSSLVATDPSKKLNLEQRSNSLPISESRPNIISPEVKLVGSEKEVDAVTSELVIGPESKHEKTLRQPPMNSIKGKSDFSRLLDAVLVNRPIIGDEEHSSNDTSKYLPDNVNEEPTASCGDEIKFHLDPVVEATISDASQLSANVNPLFIIEESFESSECKSHFSDQYDYDSHVPCHARTVDPKSHVVSPDKEDASKACSDSTIQKSVSNDVNCSSGTCTDETHETLLLADQVALSVNDILERYRSVV